MKLVIIGNGFDLHHGLKTTFRDFREYLLNDKQGKLVNRIDEIIKRHRNKIDLEKIEFAWNDIESILNKEFNGLMGKNIGLMEEFEALIENFIFAFYNYLDVEENRCEIPINTKIHNMIADAKVLMTFNYTKIYKHYLKNEETDIFHIHGQLDENNYPLIGYYLEGLGAIKEIDYSKRYQGRILHKSTMAYKQNMRDLDSDITDFIERYKRKITDVVVIGYSFGESDSHIYRILNELLIEQHNSRNMTFSEAESIPKINFYIFNFDNTESKGIAKKIANKFLDKFKRNLVVNKFGGCIQKEKEELVVFNYVDY